MSHLIWLTEKVGNFFSFAAYTREPQLFEESLILEREINEHGLNLSKKHHKKSMDISLSHHSEGINIARQTHFREMANSLEEHFHQINADLITNTREAERSMYDQRNAEFQTLIISSTVMFSGLSTVIIQGYLPHPATPGDGLATIYIIMACACGLSFAFLFICIVFFMKIVVRTSKFMYHRANRQSKRVDLVIGHSVNVMRKLRNSLDFSKAPELDESVHVLHDNIIRSFLADERVEYLLKKDIRASLRSRQSIVKMKQSHPHPQPAEMLSKLAVALSVPFRQNKSFRANSLDGTGPGTPTASSISRISRRTAGYSPHLTDETPVSTESSSLLPRSTGIQGEGKGKGYGSISLGDPDSSDCKASDTDDDRRYFDTSEAANIAHAPRPQPSDTEDPSSSDNSRGRGRGRGMDRQRRSASPDSGDTSGMLVRQRRVSSSVRFSHLQLSPHPGANTSRLRFRSNRSPTFRAGSGSCSPSLYQQTARERLDSLYHRQASTVLYDSGFDEGSSDEFTDFDLIDGDDDDYDGDGVDESSSSSSSDGSIYDEMSCKLKLSQSGAGYGNNNSRRSSHSSKLADILKSISIEKLLKLQEDEKKKKKKKYIRPGSFEYFYGKHCDVYAKLAVWLYYLGTSAFLVSCAVFMFAQFYIEYDCLSGAVIEMIFIGGSLVIGLIIIVRMEDEPRDSDSRPEFLESSYSPIMSDSPDSVV